ncbi:type II toxin-antitoxin system Phd/YefM family antitoxin [Sulfurimonas sediminis]|uniref:Antitoxin n=1 Tax=Sulfurimonas sediminis TaxID=2590020 RepID=A0A7M1B212_9BACT|nr:type II toxin-antitoxin system prevent-host-death family antitoxin [Sulfurimonas sediminis]QOP43763.1 type II toxin-antitoxin system Phd/YefM family antitoxin [Sulfurimonas sediminis]
MIAYTRDEIISASEMARGFATVLSDLKNEVKERFVISKNNKLEAVVLPIEEYERMQEALDLMEHIEIYNIVKEREKTPRSEYVSLEDLAKSHGIDLDEL